jgi:protein-tyrosine-phosphatase
MTNEADTIALPTRTRVDVLFLCTHNAARSILAEGLATSLGEGWLRGHSAGSRPAGRIHPLALATLRDRGCPTAGLRSKSWHEFAQPGAVPMDLVITVCNSAARETCPIWPGGPATVNWACADPSASGGDEQAVARAFRRTADLITRRLQRLLSVSFSTLTPAGIAAAADEIAREVAEQEAA